MARWRAAMGGTLVGLAAVVLVAGSTGPAAAQKATAKKSAKGKAEPLPLNEKVLDFAKKKIGEQVGDGECWALANEAVLAAGGKSSPGYTDFPAQGDYVWGDLVFGVTAKDGKQTEDAVVGKLKVSPGDIVQFRDAKFTGPRPGGGSYTSTAPHHTAVVAAVSPDGKTLGVYHQNVSGKRTVSDAVFALRDLREGWVRVYRPLPR
ncbi:MAG TPA: hypothetical protein VH092_12125 [Urbifossiella sp.]|nr:hypothetical protein [Urbifossiella sp.]